MKEEDKQNKGKAAICVCGHKTRPAILDKKRKGRRKRQLKNGCTVKRLLEAGAFFDNLKTPKDATPPMTPFPPEVSYPSIFDNPLK